MADEPWVISASKISSAIFSGTADESFKADFASGWEKITLTGQGLLNKVKSSLSQAKNALKQGWNFFASWWQDDPIAATAGAIAGALSIGVVVVVGGTAIGAIGGGLSAIASINFAGIASGVVTGLAVAGVLGGLVRHCIRGVQYLWNFNWNITDKQIAAQQQQLIQNLYGQAGTALGTAAGTLLCGTLPVKLIERSKIVKVNPMVLARIKEITEFNPRADEYGDLYDELMESTKALVAAGSRAAVQIAFMETYKNARSWIKAGANITGLKTVFPGLANMIEKWGAEGSQAWSFASATEEFVESISDKNIQAFTEEFLESFGETCAESMMVVSYLF